MTREGAVREVVAVEQPELLPSDFEFALAYDQADGPGVEGLPDEWHALTDGSWKTAPSALEAIARVRSAAERCAPQVVAAGRGEAREAVDTGLEVVLLDTLGEPAAMLRFAGLRVTRREAKPFDAPLPPIVGLNSTHPIWGFWRARSQSVAVVLGYSDVEVELAPGGAATIGSSFRGLVSVAATSKEQAAVIAGDAIVISEDVGWRSIPRAANSMPASGLVRTRDDRVLLTAGARLEWADIAGPSVVLGLATATITAGADLAGIGLVLAAETTLDGVPSTILVRRWLTDDDQVTNEADRWRWYVALKGQTGVTTLAAANGVLYWGGAQAWGRFSRADGLCVADGQLAPIRRILDLDDGSVFILGSGAYEWLAAPTNP